MSDGRDELAVHLDAADLGPSQRIGTLNRARRGTVSTLSFAYEPAWLVSNGAFPIDPSLALFEGEQHTGHGGLAGVFMDTAPDRWGRLLLERREAGLARREGRRARRLDEWDFLVGVSDELRMGALRFETGGQFVDPSPHSVPPLARLRELQARADEAERGVKLSARDEDDMVALLIAPGSSLGGARPKANFVGEDGALWIAKFPSRQDRHDVGAWEYLLNRLARDAGIWVPAGQLLTLGPEFRTYCSQRFDRSGRARVLFASSMTMVGKRNGDTGSYLDIVQAIERYGDPAAIDEDLTQFFRRVVFNVLVAHRDDHLRNHGFLRTARGWRLAPAFDVNPLPDKTEHTLTFDDRIRLPDLALVIETAPYYRVERQGAKAIVDEVRRVVARWRDLAREVDISRDEVGLFEVAFER